MSKDSGETRAVQEGVDNAGPERVGRKHDSPLFDRNILLDDSLESVFVR